MKQIQYTCNLTYGKFSYWVKEWVWANDPEDTVTLATSVARRWSTIKATRVLVSHFRVVTVRDDVKPSRYQIAVDEGV
jgi:hypothetical protein